MTALERALTPEEAEDLPQREPRRRHWTQADYSRLVDFGIVGPDERVTLRDGEILLQRTDGERRTWTFDEYERMGACGLLGPDERVELIDGEILEMSPQLSLHATGLSLAHEVMREVFGRGYYVRQQLPLRLYTRTEPEPDVAVVSGAIRDYVGTHPETALLVLEVSDTTLRYDRGWKASLYASAGIPDYWIVDLVNDRVEVHRDPVRVTGKPYGYGYRSVTLFQPDQFIVPLAAPESQVAVSDLLPNPPVGG